MSIGSTSQAHKTTTSNNTSIQPAGSQSLVTPTMPAPSYYTKLNKLSMNCTRSLRGHREKVYAIDWNPRKPTDLASIARDCKLIIWNAETTLKKHALDTNNEFIMTCQYSPSSKFIACGGLDDLCTLWDVSQLAHGKALSLSLSLSSLLMPSSQGTV